MRYSILPPRKEENLAMGKPSGSAPRDSKRNSTISDRYSGEPTAGSSSAVPLLGHSDNDEETRDSDEELPGYSEDIEGGDEGNNGDRPDSPPPFTPYRPVVKRVATLSDTLTVSHDPHLNTDGEALYRWLKEESLVPPKPLVCIKGTHRVHRRNGDRTEVSTRTDFALKLALGDYLLEGNVIGHTPLLKTVDPNKKTSRGGRWRTVATDVEAQSQRTVRSWADQYCEDKSMLKEFVMKKSCVGWDLSLLENRLEGMIRATNYRGSIEIQFPVLETRVEVFPSNRISRMRRHEGWRWFFFLTFLWIFAWPYLWFFTKRYHVAETVWNYSKWVLPEGQTHGRGQTICVKSEEEWLRTWGPAITRAAKARRQGPVTSNDIDEMSRAESREQAILPGTGNAEVDGMVRLITGIGAMVSRSELVSWGEDERW